MSKIVERAKRIAGRARKAPARAAIAAVAAVALVGGGLVAAQAASGNDLIAWAQTAIEQKADEIAYAATDGLEAVQAAMGGSNGAAGEEAAEAGAQGAAEAGAADGGSDVDGASGDGAEGGFAKAGSGLQEDVVDAHEASVDGLSEDAGCAGAQGTSQPASSGASGFVGGLLGQTPAAPSPGDAVPGDHVYTPEQLSIEVPSSMVCAVKADGTVVVPDQPVKNTGDVDCVVKHVSMQRSAEAERVLTTPETVEWTVSYGASSWEVGDDPAQPDVRIAAGGEEAFSWSCELGGATLLDASGAGKYGDVMYTVTTVDEEPCATVYENGAMIFTMGEPTDEEAALYGGGTAVVGQWTGFTDVSYGAREDVPWYADRATVKDVTVVEPLAPANMGYWFCEMSNLETVDFEKLDASKSDSFYRLFYSCSKLKEFDEPGFDGASSDSVARMFDGCSSIVKINAPKLVSAACASAEDFAQNCAALTSLDVSGWDSSSVESFAYFLDGCSSLEQCDLSGLETGACASFSGMMQGCEKLVTPGDLSGWDMKSAESLASMFYQCYAMTGLGDLSGWEFTGSLDSLRNMFAECYELVDVGNLDDWNVASCTTLRGMFVNCQKLVNIGDISNWDVGNVTSLERTFVDCFVLPHIGDLSGWDVSNVDDFELTFAECQALTSLGDLSGWRAPKATTYESCFQGCQSLESIGDLSQWPMGNVTSTDSMFERCLKVPTLGDLGSWVMPLNTSYAAMFSECYELASVGDISGWQTGASTSFKEFMYSCYAIDGVGDLGGWDVSSATSLQSMFFDARTLSSVGDLSAWQVGGVESFRLAFANMYSVTTLGDLSAWDVSSATTLYGMFDQTDKVASLGDLGGWDVANVENFRGVFGGMKSLREVGDLSAWNTAKGTNFYGMFHDTALEELDLSGWDTRSAVDMTSMFSGMDVLRKVTVGADFSFDGNGTLDVTTRAVLPTPYPSHIPGADGMWHAESDGAPYAPEDVPDDKTDTYYAVVDEMPAEEGEAVATLFENGTMIFTQGVPTTEQNATYGGAEDAAVVGQWTGFEEETYAFRDWAPWALDASRTATKVVFAERVKPVSTAFWFYGFEAARSYEGLENLDMSSVTDASCMFAFNSALEDAALHGILATLDVGSVENFASFFERCDGVERVSFPEGFDTSKGTNFSAFLARCSNLSSVDLSNLDTSNGTYMASFFFGDNRLADVTFGGKFDVSKNESFTQFFDGCKGLKRLDLSDGFDTSSGTRFEHFLDECSQLETVDFGDAFDMSNSTTNLLFFGFDIVPGNPTEGLPYLREVTLPAGFSFDGCSLPEPHPTYIPGADGKWYDADGNGWTPDELAAAWTPEMAGTYTAVAPVEEEAYATLYGNGTMIFTMGEPTAEQDAAYGAGTADEEGASGQGGDGVSEDAGGVVEDAEAVAEADPEGADAAGEEGRRSPVTFGVADGEEDGEVVVEVLDEGATAISWSLEDGEGRALEWGAVADGTLDDSGGTVRFAGDGDYVLVATVVGEDGKELSSRVGMSLDLAEGDEYGVVFEFMKEGGEGDEAAGEAGAGWTTAEDDGPAGATGEGGKVARLWQAGGAESADVEGAWTSGRATVAEDSQVSAIVTPGEVVKADAASRASGASSKGASTFWTGGAAKAPLVRTLGPAATWTTKG